MGVTSIQTLIAGNIVKAPTNWEDSSIHAAFGTDSSQPQVETDRLEFVLDGASPIIKHVEDGNIFEPLACQQIYTQRDGTHVALDGYFDVSDGYEELDPTWGSIERPNRVSVKFKQNESISSFLEKINGVTYGSLVNEGFISSQDYTTINTVIIKKTNFIEIALALLSVYLIQKQIADAVRSIQEAIANILATATGSAIGSIAAAILAVALLTIQIAYAVLMVALLVAMVKNLMDLLIPPVVKNVGIKFKTLLQKSCEKFGYTLQTNIEELDIYHYMPSKPSSTNDKRRIEDLIPKHAEGTVGIPNVSDYGYLINEMWDLMKTMFNTRIAVIGNVIHLYNANDPFWLASSSFVPHESINFPSKKYNTDDLKQTRMMTFATDVKDDWTVDNYKGTSYEIKTESTTNSVTGSIKGLERLEIPLCLPNSKTKLTKIEEIVLLLAGWADALAKAMLQPSNIKGQFEAGRVNILKVSQNHYSVAKVIPLKGLNVPPDSRDILSAKFLMEKFHYGKSFVGEALGQKLIYEDVDIPFNLSDLKKTLKSGVFALSDGRIAEFISIDYNFSKDMANCSLSIQDVYTTKLKEITFEP